MDRRLVVGMFAAALIVSGCSIQSKHEDGEHREKNVKIETPLGGMNVKTDEVEAKDTGLSVYPGAVLKERENDKDEKKANVNIDTPWFGLKVVALSYQSKDSNEKIWEYYKKEMSKYGRVLECKPGSPDMEIHGGDDEVLTCRDSKKARVKYSDGQEMSLKVGTPAKQRIVAVKRDGSGTEFSLVYVATREKKETL
jgi:hypothetical protein